MSGFMRSMAVDDNRHDGKNLETIERFAAAASAKSFFEPRAIARKRAGNETERQPAIAHLSAQLDGRLVFGPEKNRDVRVRMQN
jgi:hypothetical protein